MNNPILVCVSLYNKKLWSQKRRGRYLQDSYIQQIQNKSMSVFNDPTIESDEDIADSFNQSSEDPIWLLSSPNFRYMFHVSTRSLICMLRSRCSVLTLCRVHTLSKSRWPNDYQMTTPVLRNDCLVIVNHFPHSWMTKPKLQDDYLVIVNHFSNNIKHYCNISSLLPKCTVLLLIIQTLLFYFV